MSATSSMSRPRAATSVATSTLRPAGAEALDRGGAILLRSIGVNRGGAQARCDCSCRARRSQPIFVLTKTIAGSCDAAQILARGTRPSRAPAGCCASCVIVCAGPRRDPTCTNTDVRRQRVGEPHHFFRHRRREQHRLARRGRRQRLGDLADVGPEAHVHHAVGFVEHEDLELREVADVAAHVIEQPARRGDDDVDAGLERALLRFHRHAAVDGDARRPARDTRSPGPRRRSASRARAWARGSARASSAARRAVRPSRSLANQARQDRQHVRRRLARAGLRAADDVAAGERVGQHGALNRRRLRRSRAARARRRKSLAR